MNKPLWILQTFYIHVAGRGSIPMAFQAYPQHVMCECNSHKTHSLIIPIHFFRHSLWASHEHSEHSWGSSLCAGANSGLVICNVWKSDRFQPSCQHNNSGLLTFPHISPRHCCSVCTLSKRNIRRCPQTGWCNKSMHSRSQNAFQMRGRNWIILLPHIMEEMKAHREFKWFDQVHQQPSICSITEVSWCDVRTREDMLSLLHPLPKQQHQKVQFLLKYKKKSTIPSPAKKKDSECYLWMT